MAEAKNTKTAPANKSDTKTPRERFTTVGASRVKKAIKALRNLKPVASRKSYEYSAGDVSKLNAALDKELADVKAVFAAALEGKGATKEDVGFTF
jgi:hypothetical protein